MSTPVIALLVVGGVGVVLIGLYLVAQRRVEQPMAPEPRRRRKGEVAADIIGSVADLGGSIIERVGSKR